MHPYIKVPVTGHPFPRFPLNPCLLLSLTIACWQVPNRSKHKCLDVYAIIGKPLSSHPWTVNNANLPLIWGFDWFQKQFVSAYNQGVNCSVGTRLKSCCDHDCNCLDSKLESNYCSLTRVVQVVTMSPSLWHCRFPEGMCLNFAMPLSGVTGP